MRNLLLIALLTMISMQGQCQASGMTQEDLRTLTQADQEEISQVATDHGFKYSKDGIWLHKTQPAFRDNDYTEPVLHLFYGGQNYLVVVSDDKSTVVRLGCDIKHLSYYLARYAEKGFAGVGATSYFYVAGNLKSKFATPNFELRCTAMPTMQVNVNIWKDRCMISVVIL